MGAELLRLKVADVVEWNHASKASYLCPGGPWKLLGF